MRIVIKRVNRASVTIDNKVKSAIEKGLLILLGIEEADTDEDLKWLTAKAVNLRIFDDENGKTNLSLSDVDGELLLISQFTLYADCKKGNRPSFTNAGAPDMANSLYEYIISECERQYGKVQTGIFGADMKVELLNDGPFTIILDSNEIM